MPGTGEPGEASRLPRREVTPGGGEMRVRVEEGGFDEELIGAFRESTDRGDVGVHAGGVGHIGDPLAGADTQGTSLEISPGEGAIASNT